jgi:hypothetical protein
LRLLLISRGGARGVPVLTLGHRDPLSLPYVRGALWTLLMIAIFG